MHTLLKFTYYAKEDGTVGINEQEVEWPDNMLEAKGWIVMDATGEMELIRWLMNDYIPLGEFCIVGAYGGSMKSTMMSKIVADVTHGKVKGEYFGQPKGVLWFGGEESWNKSIKPRLVAAGADVSRVKQIKPPPEMGRILNITDPEHVEILRQAIKAYDVALIIFDPMTSHMGGVYVDKEEDLREALEPFIDEVCHTDGVSVVGIKHFTKLESADPEKLLGGNRAWSNIARSFIAVALHPDCDKHKPEDAQFVVGVHKGNHTRNRTPQLFRPVEVKLEIEGKMVDVPTIEWLGDADYTPEEALQARLAAQRKAGKPDPRITAEAWLRDFLENAGPSMRIEVITSCAAERGDQAFKARTLDRAWEKITEAGDAGPRTFKGKDAVWSLAAYQDVPQDDLAT